MRGKKIPIFQRLLPTNSEMRAAKWFIAQVNQRRYLLGTKVSALLVSPLNEQLHGYFGLQWYLPYPTYLKI